jgi:hypothetical protein
MTTHLGLAVRVGQQPSPLKKAPYIHTSPRLPGHIVVGSVADPKGM